MFGLDTHENIPQSFLTDHDVWDRYIGDIWHSLLQYMDFNASGTVIEIAPGASIKIGAALARAGFQGHLYVVDTSADVIAALKPRYESLLPNAQITWVCKSLHDSQDDLPQYADFLLASNMIDDMMIYHAAKENALSWASSYTHVPAQELQKAWRILAADDAKLSATKIDVRENIVDTIKKLGAKRVILNQYPSSTLYDHGMGALNDHAYDVLSQIKARRLAIDDTAVQKILNTHKHYNNQHIGTHVLNAAYWMLCKN